MLRGRKFEGRTVGCGLRRTQRSDAARKPRAAPAAALPADMEDAEDAGAEGGGSTGGLRRLPQQLSLCRRPRRTATPRAAPRRPCRRTASRCPPRLQPRTWTELEALRRGVALPCV